MQKLNLSQFTGSQSFYPFTLSNSVLTEGTAHVAEELGAYWLMEKIDLLVRGLAKAGKDVSLAVANLKPAAGGAKLKIEDGNYNVLVEDQIEFTDLDFDRVDGELTVWVSPNGQGFTLYLPSER
jgi:hypothetical protein